MKVLARCTTCDLHLLPNCCCCQEANLFLGGSEMSQNLLKCYMATLLTSKCGSLKSEDETAMSYNSKLVLQISNAKQIIRASTGPLSLRIINNHKNYNWTVKFQIVILEI